MANFLKNYVILWLCKWRSSFWKTPLTQIGYSLLNRFGLKEFYVFMVFFFRIYFCENKGKGREK